MKPIIRFLTVFLLLAFGASGARAAVTYPYANDYLNFITALAVTNNIVTHPSGCESSYNETDSKEYYAVTTGGEVFAKECDICSYGEIRVHVKPEKGFSVRMDDIHVLYYDNEKWTDLGKPDRNGITYGDLSFKPYDPAEDSEKADYYNKFDKERFIYIYHTGDDAKTKVQVNFVPDALLLYSKLGENASVEFYDGGATEPSATSFDPSKYIPAGETGANEINVYDNSNGADRYIIVHVVPNDVDKNSSDDYWTDLALLSIKDATAEATATNTLTLLKRDEYDEGTPSDPKMVTRYDGAGWYCYKLPGTHTVANGYKSSSIEGDVVKKFNLDDAKGRVSQSGNVVTVTDGTENGWKALITLDKVSFPFDATKQAPTITNITIQKGGVTKITLTDANIISRNIRVDGAITIGRNFIGLYTGGGDAILFMGWFVSANVNVNQAGFDITVPFAGSGTTADDPWQISKASDLNLLAKCVNIGKYDFKGGFLKQTADISMETVTDFLPIGCLDTGFYGSYDGGDKTISKLKANNTVGLGDTSLSPVGLFGRVVASATISNVNLSECVFDDAKLVANNIKVDGVGGIAGWLETGSTISNCTVSKCDITGSDDRCAVGGIVGKLEVPMTVGSTRGALGTRGDVVYDIMNCTVDGCVISNTMTTANKTLDGSAPLVNYTGGIVGLASGGSLSGNLVKGETTITSEIDNDQVCPVGAIIGEASTKAPVTTLNDNKYRKFVVVTRKNSAGTETKDNYNARGTIVSGAFADITTNSGAMMEAYPVSFSYVAPTGYTVPDGVLTLGTLTQGTDYYSKDNDGLYYFSPDDKISVTVNTPFISKAASEGDIRQLCADLNSLTLNDEETNFLETKTFTMPEGKAAVKGTFTESGSFIIKTNGKDWMSFFQNLGDYTVKGLSSGASGTGGSVNLLELLTISGIDFAKGIATLTDLGGICFKGVPMLLYCKGGLPEQLLFSLVTGKTAPQFDPQFKGGVSDLSAFDGLSVYVLFGSELVKVDLSDSKLFDIYKAFVVAASTKSATRLALVRDGATAIDLVTTPDEGEGKWFDLQGRQLDGKPSKKGLYIRNGKKMIIK